MILRSIRTEGLGCFADSFTAEFRKGDAADTSALRRLRDRLRLLEDSARQYVVSNELDRVLTTNGAQNLNASTFNGSRTREAAGVSVSRNLENFFSGLSPAQHCLGGHPLDRLGEREVVDLLEHDGRIAGVAGADGVRQGGRASQARDGGDLVAAADRLLVDAAGDGDDLGARGGRA